VIEAYNSTKKKEESKIKLDSYNLDRVERALDELRGAAAPSSGARGDQATAASSATHGMKGGKAVKRRLDVRES